MPTEDFIRNRITQLRMQKDVSGYKMSLDLGHSRSYIQSISSGRAMPSMGEFLYICEYLGVTPKEFFDEQMENPVLQNTLVHEIIELSEGDIALVRMLIKRLTS